MAKNPYDQSIFDMQPPSSPQGPVECLGMTFENNEKRREHFLEKLREKLKDPEFHKIEGFPIGSDEDILALSDPPYYTACPNPFVADFVRSHGQPYDPSKPYAREPFASDVSEGKNDPIYNAHPYHTKVPPKALMRLLLHYTAPGDIVLDAFCGSGMLGVAASLCQDPARHLGNYAGTAGVRHAILSDISPLACSIANVNSRPQVSSSRFASCAAQVLESTAPSLAWMFRTHHPSGTGTTTSGEILYCIWSEFYECPTCSRHIRAWDAIVDRTAKQLRKTFPCPFCGTFLDKEALQRVTDTYYDSLLGRPCKRNKSELVWIHYKVGGRRFEKAPDANDIALLGKIEATEFPPGTLSSKVNFRDPPWGDLYRSGYHAGVTHAHHFFTKRNLVALMALRNSARCSPLAPQMMFILTGFVDNHASKRNRYLIDKHHPSGTTCGPLSNSLYIPELQCEVNPFLVWQKTMKKQAASFAVGRPSTSIISTEASRMSQVPDRSVDYVFVDPPFGQNIFYSESSFCWEYFLGVATNARSEAIISRHNSKGLLEYRQLVSAVLGECYRVLKPGRWITVEFSNRSNAVWNALSEAIQVAGLVIADVRVFDKKHGTIRQDMGQSIKKDLIISAYRPSVELEDRFGRNSGTDVGIWEFVSSHLAQLPLFVLDSVGDLEPVSERFAPVLFDRMVAFHVRRAVAVPLSAGDFYAGLAQRFSERDSMYFLPEQACEYDRKRLATRRVVQLQLFVTDESSAIQWLKQQLVKKPQTFQELHPQFLKEIGGWQRNEKPLELSELLEQNFLRFDGKGEVPNQIYCYLSTNFKELRNLPKEAESLRSRGKDRWYVPDPRKAGDLEKLRERSLLKEFEDYRTSSQKRLKVFRLEAVRAGFKKAWQERDYGTIITVARKVPENVLQEDPKLLMWYDQAITRMGEDT